MSNIRKLRFWCYKVLPLVYDDSLSYYELLCKVIDKVNEIIETDVGYSVADPIEWNITSQYPQNTLVVDSEGTAYISKQPVPVGVDINNEDYWVRIFGYGENMNELRDQICYNAKNSTTTEKALSVGDLVFWNEKIYKVISDMPAGMAFIEDTNVEQYTVDQRIKDVEAAIPDYSDEIESLQQEDITLQGNIDDERDERIAGDNALNARINEIDAEAGGGNTLYVEFLGRKIRRGTHLSAQGLTIKYNGISPIIYTAYYNYVLTNESVIIQSMNTDGSVISTSGIIPCIHGNGMCYNSLTDLLYLTSGANLLCINPSTLIQVTTIALDHEPMAIAYDYDNNVYYTFTLEGNVIRKLNSEFETVESYPIFAHYGVQGLAYYDGSLYATLNQPECLIKYDIGSTLTESKVYHFENFCSQYYPLGEIQGIGIYGDGEFIISGKPREFNKDTGSYEVGQGICTFARGNILKSIRYSRPYTQLALLSVYNTTYVNSETEVFKPDGSANKPYTTLGEIALVLNAPNFKPANITLIGDFSNETLALNNHQVNIGGATPESIVNIKDATLYECDGILRNVRIVTDTEGALHLVRSRMTLSYVFIPNNASSLIVKVDSGAIAMIEPERAPWFTSGKYFTYGSGIITINSGYGVVSSDWSLLGGYEGPGNSTVQNITLDLPINYFMELRFVVLRSSNSRVVASVDVSTAVFINGGCYILGGYGTYGTGILGGCFIYVDNSHMQIAFETSGATENFKYRVYAK